MMIRIGSYEDEGGLTLVGKNIQAIKTRLWEGLPPLSYTQWRAKELDKPENFGIACQYLSAVIATFEYLNAPSEMAKLRETFNRISVHLSDFGNTLNTLRSTQGKEPVRMVALWEEFMRTHYQVMTTRAHSWVLSHVNALRRPIIRKLRAHQPPSMTEVSPEQWELTDKLQLLGETCVSADWGIWMPMAGYIGCSLPTDILAIPELRSHDWDVRRKAHMLQARGMNMEKIFIHSMSHPRPRDEISNPEDLYRICITQMQTHNDLRTWMRGEPTALPMDQWILDALRLHELGKDDNLGFDVYRLTYSQTDEEWGKFVQKFEADAANWGDGIAGADQVRGLLKLRWLDGKELGIPEGDINAAKRYVIYPAH
jgi:hypothetical protein